MNKNWSADIRVKTLDDFFVDYLNKIFPMTGSSLQYQTCKSGPTYVVPTRNKLRFLLRSIWGLLSMTDDNDENYLTEWLHHQMKRVHHLWAF